ncbi:MEDS domain-containing protein [Streptomyces sp. NPDC002680]|uniref:MEDS domain-containing protein n=1 Tax=Streptomyces sp. NPDC002680 TaxID=3364659 RepID=UPI00368AAD98
MLSSTGPGCLLQPEKVIRMLPSSTSLGTSDVSIAPGDHVCVFYTSLAERDGILLPFLREGLRTGEKCVCVVDTTEPAELLDDLGADADLKPVLDRRQLEVYPSQDVFLRGGGFSMERVFDWWEQNIAIALQNGFRYTRAASEMTWALHPLPILDELLMYEAVVNQFLIRNPYQGGLCLYPLDQYSGETLVEVLKTHPKMVLGGMVLDNPYYLDPDEFLALRQ